MGDYPTCNNRTIKNSIGDSIKVLRDFFIISDSENLGLFSNKGIKGEVNNRWEMEGFPGLASQISYGNWLDLNQIFQTHIDYHGDLNKNLGFQNNNSIRKNGINS